MTLQTLVRNKYRLLYFATGIGVIIFALSIASCSGNEKEEQKENTVSDDSVQTIKSIASEDSMMIFNNSAENWISKSIQKNNLDWNRFSLDEFWSDDSLQKKTFEPDKEFYKDYAQVLRWSPDSNYILDFGSYGSVQVKDKAGNTHIENGEPDTEVSILYPKEKHKTRLLFFGPSTTIVDGRWLDSSQVAVLGLYDKNGDHQSDTLLWIINAKENFFRKYKLK
jgi:hypothetical protein